MAGGRLLIGGGDAILACDWDDGGFGEVAVLAELPAPSYLERSADGRFLYAVSETGDLHRGGDGAVAAFSCDTALLRLDPLGLTSSGGALPCHLRLGAEGRVLAVANYLSGSVAILPRDVDGRLGEPVSVVRHEGSSIHPERQQHPYAHMVCFDPTSGELLVCDLGMDCVLVYRVEPSGALVEDRFARLVLPPGSGPRHLAFHPDGRHAVVVNELSSTVAVLRRGEGRFELADVVSSLSKDAPRPSFPAAVRFSPGGRQVYVSNRHRGEGSIASFDFDESRPGLALTGLTPSGGTAPRDIVLCSGGERLVVANQRSDRLCLFAIDPRDGALSLLATGAVPAPACVLAV
jgi:6-phosphogluconolactonase